MLDSRSRELRACSQRRYQILSPPVNAGKVSEGTRFAEHYFPIALSSGTRCLLRGSNVAEGPAWARKRLRQGAPLGVEGEVSTPAAAQGSARAFAPEGEAIDRGNAPFGRVDHRSRCSCGLHAARGASQKVTPSWYSYPRNHVSRLACRHVGVAHRSSFPFSGMPTVFSSSKNVVAARSWADTNSR